MAAAGHGSREIAGKEISRPLEKVIADREGKCFNPGEKGKVPVTDSQKEILYAQIIQPIICAGDAIGAVILIGKSERICLEPRRKCWYRQRQDFWEDRWSSKKSYLSLIQA